MSLPNIKVMKLCLSVCNKRNTVNTEFLSYMHEIGNKRLSFFQGYQGYKG